MKNFIFKINRAIAADKTKLFTLLFAIVASTGTIYADAIQIGDLYYNLDNETKTAEVTSKPSGNYTGDITIPVSVDYESLTYSVTSIGGLAFSSCTGLTSVTIPNSVTSIGLEAFQACSGLTSIEIPNSVTSIEDYTFHVCTGLTSVTIPNSVTSIGGYAFSGCTGLTSIEIPNSVTSIREWAFYGCTGLTSVTIGNSVTSIGEGAFYGCTGLPVENNIRYADTYLVEAVDKMLATYSIRQGTKWIGSSAFTECTYLTNIEISNSVTSIGRGAFEGCSGLTSIEIPNSVTSIGEWAFYGCTGLTSVTIPNSVTCIADYAFRGCSGLTSVTIPNSVTSIGNYAFWGCTGLTSVTIPNSVTSIGSNAFYDVPNIFYSGTATGSPWGAIFVNGYVEGWLIYSDNTKTSLLFCSRAATGAIEIPNSVTSIGEGAFCGCTGLTSVTIPNSVTSIGYGAFCGCTGLTSVTIPNSVTSIGYGAFEDCTGLTSVTIGSGVTSIGTGAFLDCSGLTSITCEAVIPPICQKEKEIDDDGNLSEICFVYYGVDKSIPLYVPTNSISAYETADGWKEFTNILPIQATNVNVTDVVVNPSDNSVIIQWPTINGAYTYELVIKDKNGNIICTLIFNAQGQLLSIAFNAPKRNNAPQQTQTAGFAFTVTGLDSGTRYIATITSKASNGSVLNTKTVSFTTTGQPQSINQVNGEVKIDGEKIIRNGQLYIQRGDEVFNAQGARVR